MQKLKKHLCLFFVISSISFVFIKADGHAQKTPVPLVPGNTPYPNAKPLSDKASCTFKDFTPKLGPVREQTAATCYAYSALELLSYGNDKKYSALHLAGQMEPSKTLGSSRLRNNLIGFGKGNASNALKAAFKNGVCPESVIPSTTIMKEEYEGMIESFNKSKKNTMEVCNLIIGSPIEYIMKQNLPVTEFIEKGRVGKSSWEELEFWVKLSFPTFPSKKLMTVYNESDDYSEFIQKLNNEACTGKTVKLPIKKIKDKNIFKTVTIKGEKGEDMTYPFIYEEERKELFEDIALALDNDKPVAIGFHSAGLLDTSGNLHVKHNSVITGRVWRPNGGCFYLMKNSWGPDWKPSKKGKALASKEHPGHFLVSEKTLMEHAYVATYLED